MFESGISPQTRRDLASLSQLTELSQFYLAGGTAVALHLGHRISYDLDFFTSQPFNVNRTIRNLKRLGSFKVEDSSEGTINGIFNDTKASFFIYPYPLLEKPTHYDHIPVSGERDLMCMKIDAISNRGKRRDFVDLYALSQKYKGLQKAFRDFQRKYRHDDVNLYHVLKSLTYFEDAKTDQALDMLAKIDWKTVEKYFQREVPALLKLYL